MLLVDALLWLSHSIFSLSACLGSQLWLFFSAFLPAQKTVSYFVRNLVEVVVPRFLYVTSVFYRDVVDCVVAVLSLLGHVVKAAVFNLLPQLPALVQTGIDFVMGIILYCCSIVAFLLKSFLFIFSMVKLFAGFLMQSIFNVVATFLRAFLQLMGLLWTVLMTSALWTMYAATVGGVFLLRCLQWLALFLQQAVFVLLHHIMTWIAVTVVAVSVWWIFTHWGNVWMSLGELLHVGRVWVSSASRFGSGAQTMRDEFAPTDAVADNTENEQIFIEGAEPNVCNQPLCIICCDGPRDTVLFPCRHLNLCGNCAFTVRRQQLPCPVCRKRVRRTEKVFL